MAKDRYALFRQKSPELMQLVMNEFGIDVLDAAAIAGNGGHESGGFRLMQEAKPVVAGSRGGWGLFQWTGKRRRQFEEFARKRGKPFTDFGVQFEFLVWELKNTEKGAIPALKRAQGLEAKVKAFEMAFERAGVKHYPSRIQYAKIALKAFESNVGGVDVKDVVEDDEPPHGQVSEEIRSVQMRLKARGYHEVGLLDGKWGGRTAGAIGAFMNDRQLLGAPIISDVLLAELTEAEGEGWTRPITKERAEGVPEGSKIKEASEKGAIPTATGAGFGIAGLIAWIMEKFDAGQEMITNVMYSPIAKPVIDLVKDKWWLLLLAGGGYVLWQQYRARQARIEDYRNGVTP